MTSFCNEKNTHDFIILDDIIIWTTLLVLKRNEEEEKTEEEEEKFEFLKIPHIFAKKKTSKSKSLCRRHHHHTYVGARSAPAWSESQNSSTIGGQFVFRAFVFVVAVVVETRWCWCCSLRGFLFVSLSIEEEKTHPS